VNKDCYQVRTLTADFPLVGASPDCNQCGVCGEALG
jgi:hypothetical protein